MPPSSEQPLPPPVVPDYTVLRRIGGGAYGEVWLARNFTGSHFVIKVVHRCLFDHDRPYERELAGIRRFEPISRSHPSQVAIHHGGQNPADAYFYYVMDLADDASPPTGDQSSVSRPPVPTTSPGSPPPPLDPATYVPRTLKHRLRSRGRLPFAECLDIALALANALEHLHGHGLVHRDIKPSNVIFVGGVPKLADVGLVTSIDATRSFVGTEGFLPPEGPGTPPADIFSLGKALYEIATGKDRREFPELPTDLATAAEQRELSQLNAIVLKCCQHDPERRYATARSLVDDLEGLRRGRSIKQQRAWRRPWIRARRIALPAAVGGLALIAMAILLQHELGPHPASREVRGSVRTVEAGPTAPGVLDPRAIFVLPIRPAETNGAPAELCSRITDAFIDSLGLFKSILARDDTVADALDHLAGYTLFYQRDWERAYTLWKRRVLYDAPQKRQWTRAFIFRLYGWFDETRVDQELSEHPEPTDTDQRFFMASSRWVERRYAEGGQVARRTLAAFAGLP
ncbi:MAG: serine/threonine-protein kinase [Limisphaerales bacterium]